MKKFRIQPSTLRMLKPISCTALSILFLSGCVRTQNARLYLLNTPETCPTIASQAEAPTIFLAPVFIPGHLDRPGLVTQTDGHEIVSSEFHRWAEPLDNAFRQTLSRNLSKQLNSDLIFADTIRPTNPTDIQVEVWVSALSGVLGTSARLDARWCVRDGDQIIKIQTFRKEISPSDNTYRAFVQAQSDLLCQLSLQIAETIQNR